MSKTKQIEKNIAFCIDRCEMDDEEIGDIVDDADETNGGNFIRGLHYSVLKIQSKIGIQFEISK